MAKTITFLNAGYISLTPDLVAKIVAAGSAGNGVSVKFGYAGGFGHVAEATELGAEDLARLSKSDKGPAKPLSVRGWVYEARGGSQAAPAGK